MSNAQPTGHVVLTQPLSRDTVAQWYAGKQFEHDWASIHFPRWAWLLRHLRSRASSVLEIGSQEGRSALFFLNYLPECRITCIDKFHKFEARFDSNLAEFASRTEKLKGLSADVLPQLALAERYFDFIYIDGSHAASDVYKDAVLSWTLLVPGGLMLFDDYEWDHHPDEGKRPKPAIDTFLRRLEGQYEVVHRGYQIALSKRKA